MDSSEGMDESKDSPSIDPKNLDQSHLKNFVFENVNKLADSVLEYHKKRDGKDKNRIMKVRKGIADFCESYLKKIEYGLDEKVKEQMLKKIETMRNSNPDDTIILMTAHQPNLFAYSGVIRKIALLKAVEKNLIKRGVKADNIICFYGFADHDFVHNKWVRSAEMPAPLKRDGVLRFNINIDKKDLFLPSNKIPVPSEEKISSWKSQTEGWISENCSLALKYLKSYNITAEPNEVAKKAKSNFSEFWEYVTNAQAKATSLAEFSSFILAIIANKSIDSPVIFANYSDCYTLFGDEYKWLISNAKDYSDTVQKNEIKLKDMGIHSGLSTDVSELLPIWVKCECGSKYRMAVSSSMVYVGKCVHDDKEVSYKQEDLLSLIETSPQSFEPRSISMPLVFSKAFDMSCYVGGVGGLGYLMHSRAISEKLGSTLPPAPYWNVPDQYIGIETLSAAWETERIVSTYKLTQNDKSLVNIEKSATDAYLEFDKKVKDSSIPKTAVSERDKQLLETIPKSLKMAACAIDYAINIGLGPTYAQWIEFLVNGGKLQDPVKMKSIIAQRELLIIYMLSIPETDDQKEKYRRIHNIYILAKTDIIKR